jgi:hypothetical protein
VRGRRSAQETATDKAKQLTGLCTNRERDGSDSSETSFSSRPDSPATPDKKIIEALAETFTSSRESRRESGEYPTPPAPAEREGNAPGDQPRVGGSVRAIAEALQQQARSKPWQKFLPARQKLDPSVRQKLTIIQQDPANEDAAATETRSSGQQNEKATVPQNVSVLPSTEPNQKGQAMHNLRVMPSAGQNQERGTLEEDIAMKRQPSLQSDEGTSAREGRPVGRAPPRRAASASGNGLADGRLGGRLSHPASSLK